MIAKNVGIQKPSIYYYFRSKEELIDAVFLWLLADYGFEYYFKESAYSKNNFREKLMEDGLHMLLEDSTDTQRLVSHVLNEFLVYGTRESSHNKEYHEKLKSAQESFIEGFLLLLNKAADWNIIEPDGLREKAIILALTLDNLLVYPMMGVQLDAPAVWKQTIASIFFAKG